MNELKHIVKEKNNQGKAKTIASKITARILKKLPHDIEETVVTYGAILRRRIVKTASDLILALFIYATPGMSLRMLAASASLINLANMCDQAWQKKVIQCEPWLSNVLKQTMPKMTEKSRSVYTGKSVKLLDGTTIRQAGKLGNRGGESLRIHMCYNLTDGCMENICVTDKHTAEGVTVFAPEPGAIYIADAGYGKGKALEHITSCKADALFRATPNHLCLAADERGKIKIDMAAKLLTSKADIVDFSCFVHTEKRKYVPVRIVASRLPEDKALLAIERKIHNARKHQTKNIRQKTFIYAQWVVLITSLGNEYSAEALLQMYRSRWQIELLFKRIKQSFNLSVLPAASIVHSKVMVTLWLMLWSYAEQESLGVEIYLLSNDTNMALYSPWSMQRFLFIQLMTCINCLWALEFNTETHSLEVFRRLKNHASARQNLYACSRGLA